MQRQAQQPLRPMPLQGGSDIQQLLELARAGALNRSAFTSVGGAPGFLPEFSIYSTAQLSGLLGGNGNLQLDQLAQLQQLQNLQSQAALALGPGQQAQPESSGLSRNSQGKTSSRGDKSSSAYASRHQAAEARRRTRINDRLERLRQVVPHSERANTATFLEELYKYVETLQARVTELEAAQGLPLSCSQGQSQPSLLTQPWLQQAAQSLSPQALHTASSKQALSMLPAYQTVVQQVPGAPLSQPSTSSGVPFQKDRPETPPQQPDQEETEEEVEAAAKAASITSSEGSAAKRAKPST